MKKNNEAKIVQRKLFRLTRTEEGFSYERIGPWRINLSISEKDKKHLKRIMDKNINMKVGEEMMVLGKIYDKQPEICIDETYILKKKGEINPELN